jgi:hypothetical protein
MSEERLRILRMLEQGIVTYQQALELLQALGDDQPLSALSDRLASGEDEEHNDHDARDDDEEDDDEEDDDEEDEHEDEDEEDDNDYDELRASMHDAYAGIRSAMRDVSREMRGVHGEVAGELKEAVRGVADEVRDAMSTVGSELRGSLSEVQQSGGWEFGGLFGLLNTHTFREEQSLTLPEQASSLHLQIKTKNGNINLIASDTEQVQVKTVKKIQANSAAEARQLAEQAVEQTWEPTADGMLLSLVVPVEMRGCSVSFDLEIPRKLLCQAILGSKNGNIKLDDLRGLVELKSKNGNLQITGGSYEQIKACSKNGNIRLLAACTNAAAETKNGSIRCLLKPEGKGNLALSSYNGSVTLELPNQADVGYSLEATTVHGRVQVSLEDFLPKQQERRRLVGQTADFEQQPKHFQITVGAKNGSVRVKGL